MRKAYLFLIVSIYFHACIYGERIDEMAKVHYPFSSEEIDVVIPATAKDLIILEACIAGIKTHCHNIGRVIVLSKAKLTDNAEWFDESLYPFNKYDVAFNLTKGDQEAAQKLLSEPGSRLGWYYQQLLKLYTPFVIPDISSNVLILDADTVFLKPVRFMNEESAGLYVPSFERYHYPYFVHGEKFVPGFKRLFPHYSGIVHHMLFQRCVIEDLFQIVENYHQRPLWVSFCQCVDDRFLHPSGSGASEYEIYFNFVFARTDQVEIRWLNRLDVSSLEYLKDPSAECFDFISCHDWMRPPQ